MQIFKNKILLTLVILLFFFNTAPLSYAFFDNTKVAKNALLQTGTWTFNAQLNTYFTSFENFCNTNNCFVNKNIDGEVWGLCNVVCAHNSSDKKIGSSSIRVENCGFLKSHSYFIGVELISFYVGLADNSDTRGPCKFSVLISSNGSDWTNVLTNKANANEFRLVTIDMKTILNNGLQLPNSILTNEYTPLKIKICFDGTSPIGSTRLFNLDNLTIKYVSKIS